MAQLKKPFSLDSAFSSYTMTEQLGQGGAGIVYGGTSSEGALVAVKVLSGSGMSGDKKRRFKNETAFLLRNKSPFIVSVLDYGLTKEGAPFYVMKRYDGSLRDALSALSDPERKLSTFSNVLDGVEVAHLLGVVHRDLKPENVLWDKEKQSPVIADFGIANFTDDELATLVDTSPAQRLANFQYAAPEQRTPGRTVDAVCDIYALGLMLNEAFTGEVPHGTGYKQIAAVSPNLSFLDGVVEAMIRQAPQERPPSVGEVKGLIERYRSEYITHLRLSAIQQTVIPEGDIDDPLAFSPPKITNAEWDGSALTITLDQQISAGWINALHNIGNYSSLVGIGPRQVLIQGRIAKLQIDASLVQHFLDYFKQWLPNATATYHQTLKTHLAQQKRQRTLLLQQERDREEQKLRVNKSLKF